jgi:hypothetical protein
LRSARAVPARSAALSASRASGLAHGLPDPPGGEQGDAVGELRVELGGQRVGVGVELGQEGAGTRDGERA